MKRFVWNFVLDTLQQPIEPFLFSPGTKNSIATHWEGRFFWEENAIVCLTGFDEAALSLSQYRIKSTIDTYLLNKDADLNLKLRKGKLSFKPISARDSGMVSYFKKQKCDLLDKPQAQGLDISCDFTSWESYLNANAFESCTVEKERLIRYLGPNKALKLEFARIKAKQKVFFSFALESKEKRAVEFFTKRMVPDCFQSSDYIQFLHGLRA